jgi:hypothetical protein
MMIGTWVNAMLYMLEIVQVSLYAILIAALLTALQISRLYTNYPNDRPALRVMVGASFIIDTICTIAACATVYIVR